MNCWNISVIAGSIIAVGETTATTAKKIEATYLRRLGQIAGYLKIDLWQPILTRSIGVADMCMAAAAAQPLNILSKWY